MTPETGVYEKWNMSSNVLIVSRLSTLNGAQSFGCDVTGQAPEGEEEERAGEKGQPIG